jgi:Cu+-exporting ATPase
MRVFGRNGFYIKNTEVIEKLTHADTVVFDKTGTLTHSRSMNIGWEGSELSTDEEQWVRSVARNSTHPLSVMVCEWLPVSALLPVEGYKEISGLGIIGMAGKHRIMLGSRKFIGGKDDRDESKISSVYLSIDNKMRGFFKMENHYREGLKDVLAGMQHMQLHLLTGDNNSEETNLKTYFTSATQLHFNQTPVDKLSYVQELKRKGRNVIMIGDGLNDAGALLKADIGITIADDIYHFSPACDAILQSSEFGRLQEYLNFSKSALKIVYASYVISFLYNLIGLSFAIQGLLSPVVAAILMPLSSISVVSFASIAVLLLSKARRFR